MDTKNSNKNNMRIELIRCFIVGLVTAFVSLGFFIIKNNGVFTLIDDFDTQQLAFAPAAWEVIHNGGQWSWNMDLGTSLVGAYSFYNLGSPFFWIYLLFSKASYPYIVGYIYILKYAIATVTAYIYLSCFASKESEKKVDFSLIGALLYAFSGSQTVNLLFHFHDVVAFFPLLLWGIETIDNKKKRPLFALAIFINCLVNYFFFVQEVVFMILYFMVRYWGDPIIKNIRRMLLCLACGILGVGMASVLFIPSAIYITGNARTSANILLQNFVFDSRTTLNILKGILLPADAMNRNSVIELRNYNSTSCYLPFVGMSCILGFIKKDRTWLQKLIILLLVICFMPFLQSGFLLFAAVYQRWWYMFVLIMALATIKVLEKPEYYALYWGIRVYLALVVTLYLLIKYIPWDEVNNATIFFEDRFAYFLIIAVIGPVILDLINRININVYKIELIMAMGFCIVTTGITLHYYKCEANSEEFMLKYQTGMQLKSIDDQYRYSSVDNVYMLTGGACGVGAFTSCMENSAKELLELCDVGTICSSEERMDVPGLCQLLGGKYIITNDSTAENIVDSISNGSYNTYVVEGEAFPIGFAVDNYLYMNEIKSLPAEYRGIALMHAIGIVPMDEDKINSNMTHLDVNSIDFNQAVSALIQSANANAVSDFTRDSHGFRCSTNYDRSRTVFFSVPNDAGWTARIDGQQTEIINTSGMMIINVPAGIHDIEFSYQTVALKAGIIISAISWILFIATCFWLNYGKVLKHELEKE